MKTAQQAQEFYEVVLQGAALIQSYDSVTNKDQISELRVNLGCH